MKDISTILISTGSQYILPRMVAIDTKLRVFQCKIVNDILFVNKMLLKIRKVESPLSSFCKAEAETYLHLFYLEFYSKFERRYRRIRFAKKTKGNNNFK